MKIIFSFLMVGFLTQMGWSQTAPVAPATSTPSPTSAQPKQEILNQILFSETNQSWTSRDMLLYKKVLNAYLKQEKLTEFSDSFTEDFLISRLLKQEALVFEIKPHELVYNPSKLAPGEYSKKEIETELKALEYAVALLRLKQQQLTQKARFKAWIDVLRRKYQVKMKIDEPTTKS